MMEFRTAMAKLQNCDYEIPNSDNEGFGAAITKLQNCDDEVRNCDNEASKLR